MRDQHFYASIDKAQALLGWTPKYSLLDGLKDSYDKDFGRGQFRKVRQGPVPVRVRQGDADTPLYYIVLGGEGVMILRTAKAVQFDSVKSGFGPPSAMHVHVITDTAACSNPPTTDCCY